MLAATPSQPSPPILANSVSVEKARPSSSNAGPLAGNPPARWKSPCSSSNNLKPEIAAACQPRKDGKFLDTKYVVAENGMPGINWHRRPLARCELGEACRTPACMVIDRQKKTVIESVAVAEKWDRVFVRRSNGLSTVGILIDRALHPKGTRRRWHTAQEIDPCMSKLVENMLVAINGDGS